MPTENRSSNSEQMVSVPRELIDAALAGLPSDSPLWFELRELLAQPAAQHLGEPVAWQYRVPQIELFEASCDSFDLCSIARQTMRLHHQ